MNRFDYPLIETNQFDASLIARKRLMKSYFLESCLYFSLANHLVASLVTRMTPLGVVTHP